MIRGTLSSCSSIVRGGHLLATANPGPVLSLENKRCHATVTPNALKPFTSTLSSSDVVYSSPQIESTSPGSSCSSSHADVTYPAASHSSISQHTSPSSPLTLWIGTNLGLLMIAGYAYCTNVAAALAADSAAISVLSEEASAAASGAMIMDSDGFVSEEATKVAAALAAGTYKPSVLEDPGFEVWAGFIAGVIPFVIGSWEFGKRIIIQQRCKQCSGKGLVPSAKEGAKYMRKCPQCGGFFPWVSWKLFLTSTAAPGNGGPLQFPKGQEGKLFYEVPPQDNNMEDRTRDPLTRNPHNPLTTTGQIAAQQQSEMTTRATSQSGAVSADDVSI